MNENRTRWTLVIEILAALVLLAGAVIVKCILDPA